MPRRGELRGQSGLRTETRSPRRPAERGAGQGIGTHEPSEQREDVTMTQNALTRLTRGACASPSLPRPALPAEALRDKWCKDVHIRFFVGGAEGDAFGTIVYNGAKQAAGRYRRRRSTTCSRAGTSEKMVQQLREAVAAAARRHRHDGPSRQCRDHAAGRGGAARPASR